MYVKMTEQVESHVADFPIPLDEEVGDPLAYPSNVKNCIVGDTGASLRKSRIMTPNLSLKVES